LTKRRGQGRRIVSPKRPVHFRKGKHYENGTCERCGVVVDRRTYLVSASFGVGIGASHRCSGNDGRLSGDDRLGVVSRRKNSAETLWQGPNARRRSWRPRLWLWLRSRNETAMRWLCETPLTRAPRGRLLLIRRDPTLPTRGWDFRCGLARCGLFVVQVASPPWAKAST
jgi:hypothetical protein